MPTQFNYTTPRVFRGVVDVIFFAFFSNASGIYYNYVQHIIIKEYGVSKFYLYWNDGKVESAEGHSISRAFASLGYGGSAINALSHYEEADAQTYTWNESEKNWEHNT